MKLFWGFLEKEQLPLQYNKQGLYLDLKGVSKMISEFIICRSKIMKSNER